MGLYVEVPGQNGHFDEKIIIDLESFSFYTMYEIAGNFVIKCHKTREDFITLGFENEEKRNAFYNEIRELLVIHI